MLPNHSLYNFQLPSGVKITAPDVPLPAPPPLAKQVDVVAKKTLSKRREEEMVDSHYPGQDHVKIPKVKSTSLPYHNLPLNPAHQLQPRQFLQVTNSTQVIIPISVYAALPAVPVPPQQPTVLPLAVHPAPSVAQMNGLLPEVGELPFVVRQTLLEMLETSPHIEEYYKLSPFNLSRNNRKPELVITYLIKLIIYSPEDPDCKKSQLRYEGLCTLILSVIRTKQISSEFIIHLYIHFLGTCAKQENMPLPFVQGIKMCLADAKNRYTDEVELTETNLEHLFRFRLFCRTVCQTIGRNLPSYPLAPAKLEELLCQYIQLCPRGEIEARAQWRELPFISFICAHLDTQDSFTFAPETLSAIHDILISPLQGKDITELHEYALVWAKFKFFTKHKKDDVNELVNFVSRCFKLDSEKNGKQGKNYLRRFLAICSLPCGTKVLNDLKSSLPGSVNPQHSEGVIVWRTALLLQLYAVCNKIEVWEELVASLEIIPTGYLPLFFEFLQSHLAVIDPSHCRHLLRIYLNALSSVKKTDCKAHTQLFKSFNTIISEAMKGRRLYRSEQEEAMAVRQILGALPLTHNNQPNVWDQDVWDQLIVLLKDHPSIFEDVFVFMLEDTTFQSVLTYKGVEIWPLLQKLTDKTLFMRLWPRIQGLIRQFSEDRSASVTELCNFLNVAAHANPQIILDRVTQAYLHELVRRFTKLGEMVSLQPIVYRYLRNCYSEDEHAANRSAMVGYAERLNTFDDLAGFFKVLFYLTKVKDPHLSEIIRTQWERWAATLVNLPQGPNKEKQAMAIKFFVKCLHVWLDNNKLPLSAYPSLKRLIAKYCESINESNHQEVGMLVIEFGDLVAKIPNFADKPSNLRIFPFLEKHHLKYSFDELVELLNRLYILVQKNILFAQHLDKFLAMILKSQNWSAVQIDQLTQASKGIGRLQLRVDIARLIE